MGLFYLAVAFGLLNAVVHVIAACPDPGAPEFGFRLLRHPGSELIKGSKVKFGCNPGYDLVGSPVSVCLDSGEWSLPSPQCIPNCPELPALVNGDIEGKSSKYGTVAKFFCRDGFSLVGSTMVSCKGGEWSHPVPQCFANCDEPEFPVHSERYTEGFDHGDSVRFSCDPGFNMIGSNTITCQNGQWTHQTPECILQ